MFSYYDTPALSRDFLHPKKLVFVGALNWIQGKFSQNILSYFKTCFIGSQTMSKSTSKHIKVLSYEQKPVRCSHYPALHETLGYICTCRCTSKHNLWDMHRILVSNDTPNVVTIGPAIPELQLCETF